MAVATEEAATAADEARGDVAGHAAGDAAGDAAKHAAAAADESRGNATGENAGEESGAEFEEDCGSKETGCTNWWVCILRGSAVTTLWVCTFWWVCILVALHFGGFAQIGGCAFCVALL